MFICSFSLKKLVLANPHYRFQESSQSLLMHASETHLLFGDGSKAYFTWIHDLGFRSRPIFTLSNALTSQPLPLTPRGKWETKFIFLLQYPNPSSFLLHDLQSKSIRKFLIYFVSTAYKQLSL